MRLIYLFLFFYIAVSGLSQTLDGNLVFEKEVHNFGKIEEANGKVTHSFKFVNTGSSPVIINNVKASCGCTASNWSKKPVLPGKSGSVSVTYDPKGRPGSFSKYLIVYTNQEENNTHRLIIKGSVKPKPKTLEDEYPKNLGAIRLKTNHLGYGKIYKGEIKEKKIFFVNTSDTNVSINISRLPKHIKIKNENLEAKPGEEGAISLVYNSESVDDWGFIISRVYFKINGKEIRKHRFIISASIEEDFRNLTEEEKKNAPKAIFNKEVFNFGEIGQNESISKRIELTNKGNAPLIIRKIKSSCGCTVVKPDKKILKPGESTDFKVTFNSGRKKGHQSKVVTVILNDPQKPTVRLYVRGTVKE